MTNTKAYILARLCVCYHWWSSCHVLRWKRFLSLLFFTAYPSLFVNFVLSSMKTSASVIQTPYCTAGINSGLSARKQVHIFSMQTAGRSNQNKMDTGLREREHLLTLKGCWLSGFALILLNLEYFFLYNPQWCCIKFLTLKIKIIRVPSVLTRWLYRLTSQVVSRIDGRLIVFPSSYEAD